MPTRLHVLAVAAVGGAAILRVVLLKRQRQVRVCLQRGAWRVRWALVADAPTVLHFVRELAEFEKLLHEVVMTEAQLRADFEAGHWEALLCEPVGGGEPVGFSLFFHTFSSFEGLSLYLEDLYVAPSARRSGAGILLLQATAAVAASRDCARLQWQALDWNKKAVDFYTSDAVGAREKVGADGTKRLNFIMERPAISALASRGQHTTRD